MSQQGKFKRAAIKILALAVTTSYKTDSKMLYSIKKNVVFDSQL